MLAVMKSGERDYERVWLQVEASLNKSREHLSFLVFCIKNFRQNCLKYCCFFSKTGCIVEMLHFMFTFIHQYYIVDIINNLNINELK